MEIVWLWQLWFLLWMFGGLWILSGGREGELNILGRGAIIQWLQESRRNLHRDPRLFCWLSWAVETGESHYAQAHKIKAFEGMKRKSLDQEQQATSRGTQAQEEAWVRILWLAINTKQHMEPLGTSSSRITARLCIPIKGLGATAPMCHGFLFLHYARGQPVTSAIQGTLIQDQGNPKSNT